MWGRFSWGWGGPVGISLTLLLLGFIRHKRSVLKRRERGGQSEECSRPMTMVCHGEPGPTERVEFLKMVDPMP